MRREGGSASERALAAQHKYVLGREGYSGVYPEGTRSPDGRLYRGTGATRLALQCGRPVIPVGSKGPPMYNRSVQT